MSLAPFPHCALVRSRNGVHDRLSISAIDKGFMAERWPQCRLPVLNRPFDRPSPPCQLWVV